MPTIPNTNQQYTPLAPGQAPAYGTSGSGVAAYQQQLNQQNAGQAGWTPLVVDGLYGPLTQAASQFNSGTNTTPAQLYGDFNAPTGSYESEEAKAARLAQENYLAGIANPDQGSIYNNTLSRFQAEIDAVNKMYADELGRARVAGTGRLGTRTAISARRGLIGSDFGESNFQDTENANEQVYQSIERERAAKVAGILSQAKSDASAEYAKKREEFIKGIDARLAYYKGEDERKITNSQKAAQLLIDKGVDIKNIKPDELKKLASYYGITEDMIGSTYTATVATEKKRVAAEAKKRKEDIEDALAKKGNQVLGAGGILVDPKTGKVIARNPKAATGGSGNKSGLYGQLDYRTANAVLAQANKFAGLDIVKKFNTVQSAKNTIAGVDAASKNPADHQAIIYDFAKALDPESVVREGEYATIKKYAQPLFSKYKYEIENAVAGTGFLSPQAIENIKSTIENRYKANLPQYTNVYNQYKANMNNIAGQDIGDTYLTDYQEGNFIADNMSDTPDVPDEDENGFDISQLSPEQLNDLISSGLIEG